MYIGTVTGYDVDKDALGFVLVDGDGGPFVMDVNGSLFVDTSLGALDFEVQPVYTLTVVLSETRNIWSNGSFLSAQQGVGTLVVRVVDVNEAPYFVSVPSVFRVPEHSFRMSVVSQSAPLLLSVFDQDAGNNSALSVSVVGGGATYFEIVSSAGEACVGDVACVLRIHPSAPDMDYDASLSLIVVSVLVVDPAGLNVSESVSVEIVDINEGGCCGCCELWTSPRSACAFV